MRQNDRSLEIAKLAVAFREAGAVGFDIAGPEDGFLPSRHREAFEYLAGEFFPVTVHAGEAAGLESIRSALVDGRALRLGHGVRIAEDLDVVSRKGEQVLVECLHRLLRLLACVCMGEHGGGAPTRQRQDVGVGMRASDEGGIGHIGQHEVV